MLFCDRHLWFLLLGLSAAQAARKQFVWLSDIHADPYYGTDAQAAGGSPPSVTKLNTWGTMGNDPGYEMLRSATAAAVNLSNDPAFLLFSGDFTRHHQNDMPSPWENVTNIVKTVTEIMGTAFPDLLAAGRFSLGTQGNDDAPVNYWFPFTANQTTNPWASNLAEAFRETGAFTPKEANNYSYGGAFATEIGGLHIITINTIIYSAMHKPARLMGEDPFGQFAWLKSQLEVARARGKPAWIVGHIPPGIETFTFTELWEDKYVANYLAVVQNKDLGPFVAAQLFGHVHACEFRLLPDPANLTGPILLSGALSPIYNNNPAFRVIEYDSETSRPVGLAIYSAALSTGAAPLQWRLVLNVTDAYESLHSAVTRDGFLSQAAYVDLAKDLSEGGRDWNLYSRWYKANYTNALWAYGCDPLAPAGTEELNMAGIVQYTCATTVAVTEAQFLACVNLTSPQTCPYVSDDATDDGGTENDDGGNAGDSATTAGLTASQVAALTIGLIGLIGVVATAVFLQISKTLNGLHAPTDEVLDEVVAPFSPSFEGVKTVQVASLSRNTPLISAQARETSKIADNLFYARVVTTE